MDLYAKYKLLKFIHAFFVTITIATPLIVVPLMSYKFSNWWLLLGLLVVLIAQFVFLMKGGYTIISLVTLFCIGFWMRSGFNIHQYITFYYFCLLFGFVFFGIMNEYAKLKTAASEQVYESAKWELTHGEKGKQLEKEIAEEMEKLFPKNRK